MFSVWANGSASSLYVSVLGLCKSCYINWYFFVCLQEFILRFSLPSLPRRFCERLWGNASTNGREFWWAFQDFWSKQYAIFRSIWANSQRYTRLKCFQSQPTYSTGRPISFIDFWWRPALHPFDGVCQGLLRTVSSNQQLLTDLLESWRDADSFIVEWCFLIHKSLLIFY